MLITNFSAGELSEELFGRTDLGQYFQGAARIENFDIIPTGGIRKRSGSKRIENLEGLAFPKEGRIIPFIIDRENSYLIGLFPDCIEVYGISRYDSGKESVKRFASSNTIAFVKTFKEINEVQYTQKQYLMILVHPDYAPLEIVFTDNSFRIRLVPFTTFVKYVGEKEITAGLPIIHDETYSPEWMKGTGNYPEAVTFFQDRLVFGGTKRDRQRLFISEVGDVYSFATYKVFVTEERTYISVAGFIETDAIGSEPFKLLLETNEYLKFAEPFSEYYINSPLFEEDTKIVSVGKMYLSLSKGPKAIPVTSDELEDVEKVMRNYIEYKDNPERIELESRSWRVRTGGDDGWDLYVYYRSAASVEIKPSSLKFVVLYKTWAVTVKPSGGVQQNTENEAPEYVYETEYFFPNDIAKKVLAYPDEEDSEKYDERRVLAEPLYFENLYGGFFNNFEAAYKKEIDDCQFENFTAENKLEDIKDYALSIIELSMQWYFTSGKYWFYGPGDFIKQKLETYANMAGQAVIPFYTKKINKTKMTTPDCGFTFEIASDMSDAIKWMTLNKHLIIGTETAEWIVPAGVTATSIEAVLNSRYGSDKIPGTTIGDAIVFIQSGKKALVEYYLPQQDNNFRANNMTFFSKGMLYESPVRGIDFVSAPYTRIFVCREDNVLVVLLYERGTNTFAWGRITMRGKIKHIAVLPGASGFDDVFLLVRHNNHTYLEVLRAEEGIYLDSYKKTGEGTWALDCTEYDPGEARVVRVDGDVYETLPAGKKPDFSLEGEFYIGYPYRSVMRTLPVLANNRMGKQRITSLTFRFLNSFLPKVSSIAGGRNIKTDTITNIKTPFSGIHKIVFPGTWDEDVQVELIHEAPEPVKILSLNAEVQ